MSDQAHPVRPKLHTRDAVYRWISRTMRASSDALAAALAKAER